jgi:hypothetical protein
MDFYEGVVLDYLRADPGLFLNAQCLIQLNPGDNPDTSGPHWYCDAVALDLQASTVFLCEISYSKSLYDLRGRLKEWHEHWPMVRSAIARDCGINPEWPVRPWLFVPEHCVAALVKHVVGLSAGSCASAFVPRIRTLEMVQPWRYRNWKRKADEEGDRPDTIPKEMWL